MKPQAHRLVGVRPRQTQGGHHLNSSVHRLFEIETKATIGSLQVISHDERIEKPSNGNAKLSLRTAILNSSSLKIAASELHSPVPSQRERKDSNRAGHRLQCRMQSSPSWHPKRHPGFSSAVWNLAAVHRPLQAILNAPTTIPDLHELAARHRPSMRERPRC